MLCISWPSRLAGTCFSCGDDKSVRSKRASPFQVFACITSINMPLAKVSQRAKPNIHGVGDALYYQLGGDTAKSHLRSQEGGGEELKTMTGRELVIKDQLLTLS